MFSFWVVILIVSIFALVKAASYFTEASEQIGRALRMPNFIVGSVIVAIGTSAPEVLTSFFGTAAGQTSFLAGNIIGTVIANTLLGLSIAVILTKRVVKFDWDLISNDLPVFFGAALFLAVTLIDGTFTTAEGVVLILGYGVYLMYAHAMQKGNKAKFDLGKREQVDFKLILRFLVSLGVLFIASKYVVDAVIEISTMLGIATSILAASVVAIGISLPETIVAVTAARKGNFDLALGDIVGSNIFDIFIIFGVGGLFTTLTIEREIFLLAMPMMIGSIMLFWLVLIDKQFTKAEAALFLVAYLLFIGKLFHFI